VRLTLPALAQVYDARTGKYLGAKKDLTLEMTAGEARVLALLPEKVATVKVQPAAAKAALGTKVAYTIAAAGEKQKLPRAFRVEVLGPDGKARGYYAAQLAATQDTAKGSFQLALNDPAGQWKIIATDVATGVKGEGTFVVQ